MLACYEMLHRVLDGFFCMLQANGRRISDLELENPNGRDNLGDLGIDKRIIVKWIF
jgi:hypothetical protein